MKHTARRCLSLAAAAGALAFLDGCASAPPSVPAAAPADAAAGNPVQVLLRGSFTSPRGTARFRLALRRDAESFELAATDPLGRAAWMLSVAPQAALWVDHRAKAACALPRAGGLGPLGFPAIPLDSVVAILLGLAPVAALERDAEWVTGALRWRGVRAPGGGLEAWTLEEDGRITAQWTVTARGWILSAPVSQVRIEAQVVTREPLRPGFVPRLSPPAGYGAEGCDGAAVP